MPDLRSYFLDQRGPEPWAEDADLVEYLVRWMDTTCLLKGHELRPAVRIMCPEKWRKAMIASLRQGRNYDSLAARDDVLRAIEQTEPELAERLPEPQESLDTPDVKISETADVN